MHVCMLNKTHAQTSLKNRMFYSIACMGKYDSITSVQYPVTITIFPTQGTVYEAVVGYKYAPLITINYCEIEYYRG